MKLIQKCEAIGDWDSAEKYTEQLEKVQLKHLYGKFNACVYPVYLLADKIARVDCQIRFGSRCPLLNGRTAYADRLFKKGYNAVCYSGINDCPTPVSIGFTNHWIVMHPDRIVFAIGNR